MTRISIVNYVLFKTRVLVLLVAICFHDVGVKGASQLIETYDMRCSSHDYRDDYHEYRDDYHHYCDHYYLSLIHI